MSVKATAKVKATAQAQVPAADYVPFGQHLTPNVIQLSKTGDYLAIWRLEGIPFETVDVSDILVRKEALNNFLRSLGGGNFALWSHKIRRLTRERLTGKYKNEFCAKLNDDYYKTFETYRQMATELYVSVVCVFRPNVTGHFGIVTARFGPT